MQNSWKPGICISYGYQTKLCLILTTPWLPAYKRFLLQHIFVYDRQCIIIMLIPHICCLWLEKGPYLIFGNSGKLVAWTLHRFYVLKLTHPLLYDDDTITHAANDIKRIFLIVDSKILDGRSLSYLDIELCTHFHTQTLQSLHLDWWYFLHCGWITFGGFTLIFGSKYDR